MLGRCRRSPSIRRRLGEIAVGLRVGCFNDGLSPQFYAGLKNKPLVSANLLFCDGYSFQIALPMK